MANPSNRLHVLAYLLSSLSLCHALDPKTPLTDYGVTTWSGTETAPAAAIAALAQSSDGYLWLGTHEGLLRFDGIEFVTFTTANSDLPDNDVSALLAGPERSLWIGLRSGRVCRSRKSGFLCFDQTAGLPKYEVRGLAQDDRGTLWVASVGGGLRKLEGQKFVPAEEHCDDPIKNSVRIASDAHGNIWESSFDAGITVHFPDGHCRRIRSPVLPSNLVWGVAFDRSGAAWVATFAGLCRFRDPFDTKPDHFGAEQALPANDATGIYVDGENTLWVSVNNGGLSRLEGDRFHTLTSQDGLAARSILSMVEDREGNLWLGTTGGLNRLRNRTFALLNHRHGITRDSVRTLLETAAGDLIVGTNIDGLLSYRAMETGRNPERLPIADCSPLALHEDAQHALWIGCAGGTIVRWRAGGAITRYRLNGDTHGFIEVNAIADLPDGRVVAATFGLGLVTVDGASLHTRALYKDALNVAQLLRSRDSLWVYSFDKGIFRIEAGGTVTSFDGRFGARSPKRISLDSDGSLWVSLDEGLARIRGDRITILPLRGTPLDGQHFYSVIEDAQRDYWISSNRGILAVPRRYLQALAAGARDMALPVLFDSADGVAGRNDVGWSQPTALRTRDGRIWFATFVGVQTADPQSRYRNPVPPSVYVQSVLADDRLLRESLSESTVDLAARQRRVELRYTAPSLTAPEKTRFSYMLEGEDAGWIDAGARRSAFYTDLSPGSYRFRVRAANDADAWSPAEAVFTIHKLPTFEQTKSFRIACAASVIALLFYVHRLNLDRTRRESARLANAVAQERHRAETDKWQEMAHANQVLRRSAMGLAQSSHPDDFIRAFLREVVQLSGANAGACFKRLGDTEFAFALLMEGDRVLAGAELDALPCAAEKREMSRADWRHYYSSLAGGTVMSWRSHHEREQLPPFARAYHEAQSHIAFWEFPLAVDDRVAGSVGLAFKDRERPSEITVQTLDALNCQLAIALEVTRLMEEKRVTELTAVNERAIAEERTRIAREIHDTLAQNLSGILIQLRAMVSAEARGDTGNRRFHADRALELAQEGLAGARRSLVSLRPNELRDGRSLAEALSLMASAFKRRWGIVIRLDLAPHAACTPEQENEILRIVQESVMNSTKHSGASEITVAIRQLDKQLLELCVRDNGHGFDPAAPSEGFGLIGMKERAARIGAALSVDSDSSGTTVCLRLQGETFSHV